jgi:hypothetical protein
MIRHLQRPYMMLGRVYSKVIIIHVKPFLPDKKALAVDKTHQAMLMSSEVPQFHIQLHTQN